MGYSGLAGRRRVDSPSSKPGQSFNDVQGEMAAKFSNGNGFAYPPLYLRHLAAFRLLDLHPGDEGDRIKCTLRQAIRTTNVRWRRMCYSALSYTWGTEPAVIPITVNESTFFVTLNLATALQSLRNRSKFGGKRTLWVDAICINQGDANEKNHQVAQMQEIYAGAQEVIVWLGAADSTIELAISFIHDLCEHLHEHEIFFGDNVDLENYTAADFGHALEKVTSNLYQRKWCAVVEMLLKPWWGRVWVIQEVASARRAILQCGKFNLPWAKMALIIEILYSWHPSLAGGTGLLGDFYDTEDKAILRAANISKVRTLFRLKEIHGFEDLIYISQLTQCKDPRDKVYALLGLAPSNVRTFIQPDYNRSIAWTFAIVIKAHVHCHENLNILDIIQDGTAHHMFPSWAVDLNIYLKTKTRRLTEFCDDHHASGLDSICATTFSEDLLSLYTEGFILDTVGNSQIQGYREIFEWDSVLCATTYNLSSMVSDLGKSGGIQNPFKSQDTTPSECFRQGIEGTLYQTITAGYLWSFKTSEFEKTPIKYPSNPTYGITPRPLHADTLLAQAEERTFARTLILTHKRMLGLAPSSTRHGDIVCIISGLNLPAILRLRGDGTWTFVGTAYIPGLMEGQALAGLEEGIYTKRMFEMR